MIGLWFNNVDNGSNLNFRNRNLNNDNRAFGMALSWGIIINLIWNVVKIFTIKLSLLKILFLLIKKQEKEKRKDIMLLSLRNFISGIWLRWNSINMPFFLEPFKFF